VIRNPPPEVIGNKQEWIGELSVNAPDHSNAAVKDYSDHFHCCPQRLEGISDRSFRLAYCADRPTFVRPSRGLRLNPIESVKAAIKSMDFLNRAIRPFGLYLPVFAVF
jgi:hypothetical protein